MENVGNGISEPLKFEIFWGNMPSDPASLDYLPQSNLFLPYVHLQNLTLCPLKGKMRHLVLIQYNETKITKTKAMV